MSEDEFDLKALLGLPEEEPAEPTPFAQSMNAALKNAVVSMRAQGVIEVDEGKTDALVDEITEAALEASSLKRLLKRVVNTLIHSELVEEVYGTDEELSASLRGYLESA